MGSLPDETQVYLFLKETHNSFLQGIHTEVNRKLIKVDALSLDTFLINSKPVMAATKENNFKNPKRNSMDKSKKSKRNPGATLSYYSYQQLPGKKDYIFFWRYRTYVIISKEGIPIVKKTLPNNKTDAHIAKKLINKLKRLFPFKKVSIFIADAAYEVRELYNFIVNTLKTQAFIPINPRNQQPEKTFGPHGCPLYEAKLEMKSWGSWAEGLRERLKFRCPIKASSKFAQKFPNGFPIDYPRFLHRLWLYKISGYY